MFSKLIAFSLSYQNCRSQVQAMESHSLVSTSSTISPVNTQCTYAGCRPQSPMVSRLKVCEVVSDFGIQLYIITQATLTLWKRSSYATHVSTRTLWRSRAIRSSPSVNCMRTALTAFVWRRAASGKCYRRVITSLCHQMVQIYNTMR